MTSAQNHQPPLNGNKRHIAFIILLLWVMQSCTLFRNIQKEHPPKNKEEVEIRDTTEKIIAKDSLAPLDTFQKGIEPGYKQEEYRIVLMLPFYLDNSYLLELDPDEKSYHYRPMVATEYLQGFLIALEDLKKEGYHLKVSVFDTRNDSSAVRHLLKEKALRQADLIIGPLFPRNLAIVAPFAARHSIPLVSPLSGKVPLNKPNRYIIKARPGNEAHVKHLAQYAAAHFRQYPTFILHSSDPGEKELAEFMASEYRQSLPPGDEEINLRVVELNEKGEVDKKLLAAHDTNIVLVPSNNEIFVTNVLRGLNNITEGEAFNLGSNSKKEDIKYLVEPEDIFLFGMPSWIERFASSRFDYLNTLNFYTSKEFYYDTSSVNYQHFRNQFIDTFHYSPSEISMKAYDGTEYMVHMLGRYGNKIIENFPYYHHAPINGRIDIEAIYTMEDAQEILHHYENRFVHILRFDDYKLEIAPGFFSK